MSFIDVSTLLQPVHADLPCGPDLEYSSAYLEAARALEGRPEVQYGNLHVAAIEPDWKHVKTATLDLLAQSRDLRLAVWLTRSLVALHGAAGASDGLALIEGLLTRHWDHVHPQLDAEDDDDPTARINTLAALEDKTGFVRELSLAPLVDSACHGRVCLRDIESCDGEPAEGTALDPAAIAAAFAQAPFESVASTAGALADALARLARIDAWLTERTGHRRAVGMASLRHVLERASQAVQTQLARHPARIAQERSSADTRLNANDDASIVLDSDDRSDRIASRSDVVRMLDRLCGYYALAEPSSPVPVLLQRARKLVGMDFADIVGELTPAGIEQARHWAGTGGD